MIEPTPPTGPAIAGQAPEPSETAMAALEGLHWLLERAASYPAGHPVVDQARDRTYRLFVDALRSRPSLPVQAGRGSLRLGSELLDSLRCRSLGTFLSELDIVSLEFGEGTEADEILRLARELSTLRSNGGRAAARETFEAGGDFEHIRIGLLDYDAIRMDSGAQEEPVGDDPERIWTALSQTILGPPDSPHTVAPEQLADLLGDEILRLEGVGAGVLIRQLERLLGDVDHLPGDSRRDAHARIGRFLSALPEPLREELLRIDPGLVHAGRETPRPLRPDSVVTTLLFGAVRGGERPPEDAVALLNQLLRTTSVDDSERDRLSTLVDQVSAGEATPEELEQLAFAVGEIFRRREDIHANPRDYQALIDSLAKAGANMVESAPAWMDRYDDPRDRDGRRAHAVEIATAQFEAPDAERYAGDVLAYLTRSTEELIDAARFDALEGAVRAVDRFAGEDADGDPVRAEARAYVDGVVGPERLRLVLAAVPRDEPIPAAALALVRRAGRGAVDALLPVLAENPRGAFAETLHEILLEQPVEEILAIAGARVQGGWSSLRPLFPVLRRFDSEEVQDFLIGLLEHRDEKVRSESLSALSDQSLEARHVSDILFSLLHDPSPRIVTEAIRRLGAMRGQESIDLLGDFVLARLIRGADRPLLERRRLAVRVLTLRGAPGWKCLVRCLRRLSWRFRADDAELARAIAYVMNRRYEGRERARLLRAWRWSPARRLRFLYPRTGRRAEAR